MSETLRSWTGDDEKMLQEYASLPVVACLPSTVLDAAKLARYALILRSERAPKRSTLFGEDASKHGTEHELIKRTDAGIISVENSGRVPEEIRMCSESRTAILKRLPAGEIKRGEMLRILGLPVIADETVPADLAHICDARGKQVYTILLP
jgi:hypothetical protein